MVEEIDGEHAAGCDEVVGVVGVVNLHNEAGAMEHDGRGGYRHGNLGVDHFTGTGGHGGQGGAEPGQQRTRIRGSNVRGMVRHQRWP